MRRNVLLFLVLLTVPTAWAEAPRLISFQGRLAGVGTTTVNLQIEVHQDPVLSTLQFSETHLNVPVNNDVFSILIGSQTAGGISDTVFGDESRWLSVSVNGGAELTPRTQLTLSPFAGRALYANALLQPGGGVTPVIETFNNGDAVFYDSSQTPKMLFEPGTSTVGGRLAIVGDSAAETVVLNADADSNGAALRLNTRTGAEAVFMAADASGTPGAILEMFSAAAVSSEPMIEWQASESSTTGSQLFLRQGDGTVTFDLDAEFNTGGGAQLAMKNGGGVTTMTLDAATTGGTSGSRIMLETGAGTPTVDLWADVNGRGAQFIMRDETGQNRIYLDADEQNGNNMLIYNAAGTSTIRMTGDNSGNGYVGLTDSGGTIGAAVRGQGSGGGGGINLYDAGGSNSIEFFGESSSASYDGGEMRVYKPTGGIGIQMLASDASGDAIVITEVLQITGGSDLSESFDINADVAVRPGMVVAIDPGNPGELMLANQPYDRRVAGIISGANGIKPGMVMGQQGTVADGEYPVALTGRVWCYADASQGRIEPGDLLTTAATPGHAMKVADPSRATGAILGKAMTSLDEGRGFVLVLVSLQ